MKIDFKNDIHEWNANRMCSETNTIIIPSNKELFFEAKLTEIHKQYQAARLFLC